MTTALAIGAACLAGAMMPSAAWAAPGEPFSPDQPTLFVAQIVPGDTGTTLFEAVAGADGTYVFQERSAEQDLSYNAVSWNPVDGYMYAIVQTPSADVPLHSLVRIDSEGHAEPVGEPIGDPDGPRFWNVGAFGEPNMLYVSGGFGSPSITVVDVTTGEIDRTIELTSAFGSADFEFIGDYLWAVTSGGVHRIDPGTGRVQMFEVPFDMPSGAYGAAWRFGNGNLGVEHNGGTVLQIAIEDASSSSPSFELVSRSAGPASAFNDGTAIPGGPVDLSIEKTVDAGFTAGDEVEWTITVRNEGPFIASGWVMEDVLPEGAEFVSSDLSSCSATDGTVTCVGGRLPVGDSAEISLVTRTSPDATGCLTNAATVLGNDRDDVAANNVAQAETCPGVVEVEKSVSVGDGATVSPGATVTYTLAFTNAGPGGISVNHVDTLAGVTDDGEIVGDVVAEAPLTATLSGDAIDIQGSLEPGERAEVRYDVLVSEGADGGTLLNVVAAAGAPIPEACGSGDPQCTENPIAATPPLDEGPGDVGVVDEPEVPAEQPDDRGVASVVDEPTTQRVVADEAVTPVSSEDHGTQSLAVTGQSTVVVTVLLALGAVLTAAGAAALHLSRRPRVS